MPINSLPHLNPLPGGEEANERLREFRINDSPWRRLPWTLPGALATGLAALWAAAYFTGKPVERLPEPPPIEAQVIEIPPPVASKSPPVEKKITAPQTPVQRPTPAPPVVHEEKAPPPPAAAAPPQAEALPKAAPPAPAAASNMTGTTGAQAIVKPMPQIPDDLRQDALSTAAIARFHVAIDGTVTVELVKPTPNPRLNRLLLNTLKNWRFFPAMKDGKPVESTQELSIKVEVQ
jgi:protein TonB